MVSKEWLDLESMVSPGRHSIRQVIFKFWEELESRAQMKRIGGLLWEGSRVGSFC